MNNGFITVACAIPNTKVADCSYNAQQIIQLIQKATLQQQVQILCFPELCITAYTCGDLFNQSLLIQQAEQSLFTILQATRSNKIIFIVGLPLVVQDKLINAAVVCQNGQIKGIVPKTYIPNYNEFYEKRWFSSAREITVSQTNLCEQEVAIGTDLLFQFKEGAFGIEICEDLWATIPPSCIHATHGATLLFNLSASNALIGKTDYLNELIRQQSARCIAGYIYCSCGGGESSTDVVFAGNAQIAENGLTLAVSKRFSLEEQLIISEIDIDRLKADRQKNTSFSTSDSQIYRIIPITLPSIDLPVLSRLIDPQPFVPHDQQMDRNCNEIFSIQAAGLIKRLQHTQIKNVVIGISGGLDSTLALLVSVRAFDTLQLPRKQIIGITMPGFGTTGRTYQNALSLMNSLGVSIKEISIKSSVIQHFNDIGQDPNIYDVTYENSQARERTQILMDYANKSNSLVIGTGDLSELALGWATYNGDHMSMYGVNASIPKTLVRYLVRWVAETQVDENSKNTLLDIIDTPVSPELLPFSSEGTIDQKTEDIVGPYELHDFFLYYMIRFGFAPRKIFFLANQAFKGTYTPEIIKHWMKIFYRRFFIQQFKRSCLPDGPKVGSVNLSPRGDWRMPSDAVSRIWLEDIETLQ